MKRIGDVLGNNLPRRSSTPVAPTPVVPPACPICNDAGYLRADVDVTHPDFGKLVECSCTIQRRALKMQTAMDKRSSLNAFHGSTFDDFDADLPGVQDAFEAALAFSRGQGRPWLLLSGPVGVGKTHLAVAIGKHAVENEKLEVLFTVVPDLLDHLRASFDPKAETAYDERFMAVKDSQLLILDDLGTENATPWAREKLFQIINHRYTEQLPTVITTNIDMNKIDERILSRIQDHRLTDVVEMDATDYRRPGYSPKLRRTRR
jgi:DNA replication protein DnaC